jgi:hypothetical protein
MLEQLLVGFGYRFIVLLRVHTHGHDDGRYCYFCLVARKERFAITHYCYFAWLLERKDLLALVTASLLGCLKGRSGCGRFKLLIAVIFIRTLVWRRKK